VIAILREEPNRRAGVETNMRVSLRATHVLVWGMLITATASSAQTAADTPAFEAASVRLNKMPGPVRGLVGLQPGRLVATAATLRQLVESAFGVQEDRIVGAPGWAASDLFDVTATAPPDVTIEQAQVMLQNLLAERFGLRTHRETRDLPIYSLVLDRADRRLGPDLRLSGADCVPMKIPAGMPPPPPPPPGARQTRPLSARPPLRCPSMFFAGTSGAVSARKMLIGELARGLTLAAGRPVVDRTGLSGEFDIDLTYQSDLVAGGGPRFDAPPLPTALRDQLGLKLESGRGPIDVVVIDTVQQPADN
jgi:uncharacterized protein (TIGR03435 family)